MVEVVDVTEPAAMFERVPQVVAVVRKVREAIYPVGSF